GMYERQNAHPSCRDRGGKRVCNSYGTPPAAPGALLARIQDRMSGAKTHRHTFRIRCQYKPFAAAAPSSHQPGTEVTPTLAAQSIRRRLLETSDGRYRGQAYRFLAEKPM